MAFWNKFPFTNFHEMNLDWLISTMKDLLTGYNDFTTDITKKIETQDEKVNTFIEDYTKKVDKIPQLVQTDVIDIMDRYRADGTFSEIIESTYGAVSYLNTLQGKQMVVLGDSLTADRNGVSWIKEFTKLTKGVISNIINYAHSGDTLTQQATAFEAYSGTTIDIMFIFCGINDVRDQTDFDTMRKALGSIRDRIYRINPACQIYLCSTYKNTRGMKTNWVIPQTAYWRFYSNYCTENGWTFVDLFSSAPCINVFSDAIKSYFFTETGPNYLHYNDKYAPILGRYILNVLISQSPVPLGDYYERVPGTNLNANCSPVTSVFNFNTNGSYVDFGTRFVHIHIAGTFTAPNANPQYTKILTLPVCFRPTENSNYSTAYRAGGIDSDGGQYSVKALLNADGSLYLFNQWNENASKASMTCFVDFYIDSLKYDWKRPVG